MNIKVKTAPIVGAITLDEAKNFLEKDLSYTEKDGDLSSDIISATNNLSSLTGKRIMTQTIEMFFDSWEELETYTIKQGIVKSISIAYLDENKDSQDMTDFDSVGLETYYARVAFNDVFSKPDIWGIESIILTIEVGEFAAPKEYQLIVKKMMAKIYKDVKDHGMVDRFVRDNKYR